MFRGFVAFFCFLLSCIGTVLATPCDERSVLDESLPTIMMEEVLANPLRFTASDGEFYYLADLTMPEQDLLLADDFFEEREVRVKALIEQKDRWGRRPAILVDPELGDLSVWLVKAGMAIVRPQLRAFNCLKFLINLESMAREKNVGLWVIKNVINDYKSISYEQIGLYGIVEAKLISVGQTRSKTYLNFGERWTEDLTGIIQRGTLADFSEFGHDLSVMKGKRVRLRGVMQLNQGPLIELKHPAQLELLD
ncbi:MULTISPECIES: thermonuclease family protein [unclassified Pseudovibrio]|uniref:thermonuclease family protein n=1 Tax=unclassified Pseudovibrio TaxID=2627060 RepID=UPI0007AEA0B5|nr:MULTISPECIES: thermonuclease family protein [unclassified Pseudovibrio]